MADCPLKISFPGVLSIPQSVDSVSRIAWCRSIQNLVAPSRRSNSRENVIRDIRRKPVDGGGGDKIFDDERRSDATCRDSDN